MSKIAGHYTHTSHLLNILAGAGEHQGLEGVMTPTEGCSLPSEEAIYLAKSLHPSKRYCLVLDWVLIDVDMAEGRKLPDGFMPTVVYSPNILEDEAGRFPRGGWVRSTFEVSFQEGCLFETKNTIYVLMGSGARTRCDWGTLGRLF
ncbi:DUF6957 family protein [Pseudomonas nitroreducens]|uniref:DUF6957 family protein n=1 Tax=Pseudomonas nitroreducens TaxID=46680 RepID=UPI002D8070B5|nr:hypothetical protein [Pseudomonas nitroreducens]